MSSESYRWHYDYIRIAWDTGFCFDSQKHQKAFDRNGIALLDIERIIRERDIAVVEHHIQTILEYSLDVEETRILDPNFVKLFRLGQLAVEYLTYCKKYLDSTVVALKKDLEKSNQENNELQQAVLNYQSDISKMKKKIKDLKSTLQIHQKYHPVGLMNDPISTFPCSSCNKVFVNEEYLKAHATRRHPSNEPQETDPKIAEILPVSEVINTTPVHSQYKAETDRLQMEIKELKEKLNNTERYFQNEEQNKKTAEREAKTQEESQSEEYYRHVQKLHQQFELLKTQIESEMHLLKMQKSEQDKYNKWIEKIFDKLDSRTAEPPHGRGIADQPLDKDAKKEEQAHTTETEIIPEGIDSKPAGNEPENLATKLEKTAEEKEEEEREDEDAVEEKEKNVENAESVPDNETVTQVVSKIGVSPQKQIVAPRASENSSRFFRVVESPMKAAGSLPDISKVKEEVGKELEEKTKQDIEKLGEQLSEQMSETFLKLQERLECFWGKLQEIEVKHEQENSLLKAATVVKPAAFNAPQDKSVFNLPKKVVSASPIKKMQPIESSDLDDSDTESSKAEKQPVLPTVAQIHNQHKATKNLIEELKTKVKEQKSVVVDTRLVNPRQNPIVAKVVTATPVVQEIYSRPLQQISSESSSEETTESESEESEESPPPVEKRPKTAVSSGTSNNRLKTEGGRSTNTGLSTLQNRSIKSLENALITNPEILENFRDEMEEVFANRLRDIGVDPEWTRLPDKPFKHKLDIVAHHRSLAAKNIKSFSEIRKQIIENLDEKVHDLNPESRTTTPEPSTKTSRIKSLFVNMRNKAKSIMKSDKGPLTQRAIYKLTIHQNRPDSPEDEEEEEPLKNLGSRNKNTTSRTKPKEISSKSKWKDSVSKSRESVSKSRENVAKSTDISKAKEVISKSKDSAKPKEESKSKMYKSDSDTESPTENFVPSVRPVPQPRKGLRKTKSDSSMDVVDLSDNPLENGALSHIARSLSNLDSILEIKKEISSQFALSREKNEGNLSSAESGEKDQLIAVSPRNPQSDKNLIQKAIEAEKQKLEDVSSSEFESDELKEEKAQKGVLKYPHTATLTKKKVLFDLHSEDAKITASEHIKEVKEDLLNQPKTPVRKTLVKSNSFFPGDESSTSIDSSILDKKSSKVPNKGSGDKISTKAIINVSTEQSRVQQDLSDWDISDIN